MTEVSIHFRAFDSGLTQLCFPWFLVWNEPFMFSSQPPPYLFESDPEGWPSCTTEGAFFATNSNELIRGNGSRMFTSAAVLPHFSGGWCCSVCLTCPEGWARGGLARHLTKTSRFVAAGPRPELRRTRQRKAGTCSVHPILEHFFAGRTAWLLGLDRATVSVIIAPGRLA